MHVRSKEAATKDSHAKVHCQFGPAVSWPARPWPRSHKINRISMPRKRLHRQAKIKIWHVVDQYEDLLITFFRGTRSVGFVFNATKQILGVQSLWSSSSTSLAPGNCCRNVSWGADSAAVPRYEKILESHIKMTHNNVLPRAVRFKQKITSIRFCHCLRFRAQQQLQPQKYERHTRDLFRHSFAVKWNDVSCKT